MSDSEAPVAQEIDIDALYGVDEVKSSEGVWFSFGRAKLLMRHYSRSSIMTQKIMTKMSGPVRKLLDNKLLTAEQDRALGIRVFVRAALMDWKDVRFGGVEQGAYSEEKAVAVFLKYDGFFVDAVSDASDMGRFRADEDTAKNLPTV